MQARTKKLGKDLTKVDFVIDAKEVDARFAEAEVSLRRNIQILESQFEGAEGSLKDKSFSEEALAQEAVRIIVQIACERFVSDEGLRLFAAPQVEISRLPKPHHEFRFSAKMQVVPQFTISSLDDLRIQVPAQPEITDQRIMGEIMDILRQQAALEHVERGVDEDDVVNVTFVNTIDGKGYEGNHIVDYDYQMGDLILPQQFEAALMGMKAGESKYIEFVVDSDFENKEIAGKPTTFDVTVNEVKARRIPFIDNQLAKQMGYADLASWKENIRSMLVRLDKRDDEIQIERAARRELVKRLEGDIPEALVEEQAERYFTALVTDLSHQNTSIQAYCEQLGIEPSDIKEEMRGEVLTSIGENLALEALFRTLDIHLTEDDIDETARLVQVENGISSEEFFGGAMNEQQRSAMKEMSVHRLATEWLLEHVEVQRI